MDGEIAEFLAAAMTITADRHPQHGGTTPPRQRYDPTPGRLRVPTDGLCLAMPHSRSIETKQPTMGVPPRKEIKENRMLAIFY